MNTSLLLEMCARSYDFELYQWMYLIERYALTIGLSEFGDIEFNKQLVQFQSSLLLSVPATDIDEVYSDNDAIKAKINIGCLGNLNGPLEHCYIEHLITSVKNGQFALVDLLDMFNHQLVCIWYKAAKSVWPTMNIGSYQDFITALSFDMMNHTNDAFFSSSIWSGSFNLHTIKQYLESKLGLQVCVDHKQGVKLDGSGLQCKIGEAKLGEKIVGNYIKQGNYGVNLEIYADSFECYKKLLPDNNEMSQLVKELKNHLEFIQPITVTIFYSNKNSFKYTVGSCRVGYDTVLGTKADLHNTYHY